MSKNRGFEIITAWAKNTGHGTIRMYQVMRFLKCFNIQPSKVLHFSEAKAHLILDKMVSPLHHVEYFRAMTGVHRCCTCRWPASCLCSDTL